jgi:hypothetical protein
VEAEADETADDESEESAEEAAETAAEPSGGDEATGKTKKKKDKGDKDS